MLYMENKVCASCRFGSVKIEVFVPKNCNMQEFVQKTRLFTSEIKKEAGQKPIHYTLKFDSEKDSLGLDFNVICECILNVKQWDCSNFNVVEDRNCRAKHLQNKLARERQMEVVQTV